MLSFLLLHLQGLPQLLPGCGHPFSAVEVARPPVLVLPTVPERTSLPSVGTVGCIAHGDNNRVNQIGISGRGTDNGVSSIVQSGPSSRTARRGASWYLHKGCYSSLPGSMPCVSFVVRSGPACLLCPECPHLQLGHWQLVFCTRSFYGTVQGRPCSSSFSPRDVIQRHLQCYKL